MCRTAWGKWWSHQILTFLIHEILCDQPKAHLCTNHIVWSASWYATPVRCHYLGKGEALANRFKQICEQNLREIYPFIVYVDKVLDFLFQLKKNGSENKSVAFIFLFSVCGIRNTVSLRNYCRYTFKYNPQQSNNTSNYRLKGHHEVKGPVCKISWQQWGCRLQSTEYWSFNSTPH